MNRKTKLLKKRMIDRELDQRKLAQICGVSEVFMSYLLRGERTSKRCEAIISEALGYPLNSLIRLITK